MSELVAAYVESFFQRSGMTRFPTVRHTAKALRMRQSEVMDACWGDPHERLMVTGYNYCDEGDHGYPGDLCVETLK